MISGERLAEIAEVRARRPDSIAEAARSRKRRPELDSGDGLFLLAADYPARGVLRVDADPVAIGNRPEFFLLTALDHPAVDGLTATPDIVEDLLLLGALDDTIVIGSMNRSGLSRSTRELNDRFTPYEPDAISASNLDGGKMLLRIDLKNVNSNATIEACANAVNSLSQAQVPAFIEPLPAVSEGGRISISNDPEAMIRTISVANGLGNTSAYTWLALPAGGDVKRVLAATTLPVIDSCWRSRQRPGAAGRPVATGTCSAARARTHRRTYDAVSRRRQHDSGPRCRRRHPRTRLAANKGRLATPPLLPYERQPHGIRG